VGTKTPSSQPNKQTKSKQTNNEIKQEKPQPVVVYHTLALFSVSNFSFSQFQLASNIHPKQTNNRNDPLTVHGRNPANHLGYIKPCK